MEAGKPYERNAVSIAWEGGEVPVGGSKLGGMPDLPAECPWPTREDGRPMSFLAQFDLAQVHPFDLEGELPDHGLLSFFYDCDWSNDGMPWGFDPKDADGKKVFYFENEALERREFPEALTEGEDLVFEEAGLTFSAEPQLPDPESDLIQDVEIPEEETDFLFDWMDENQEDGDGSQLLGHARVVQNGMELQCEAVTQGAYLGGSEGWLRDASLARPWRLLLQLDTCEELGMFWGDMGLLYFWIRQEDLQARRFDKTWVILQCG